VIRFLANILAWSLYYSGDFVSWIIERFKCLGFLYPVYNKLMQWSLMLNDKYDLDIWYID